MSDTDDLFSIYTQEMDKMVAVDSFRRTAQTQSRMGENKESLPGRLLSTIFLSLPTTTTTIYLASRQGEIYVSLTCVFSIVSPAPFAFYQNA